MTPSDRLRSAYITARDALLAERVPAGHWVGELSTSALSTATAVMALHLVDSQAHRGLIAGGIRWLCENQNPDGGWGDTTKSFSNISTTMLCRAAFEMSRDAESAERSAATAKVEAYLIKHAGATPAERAEAIRCRYGKDRTFSVPILMACALAKLVPWNEVPRLPFELACLPQSWYRFVRLPVVSYALPALIAIGQCVHANRTSWNPIRNLTRRFACGLSLKVLRRIQPTTGGYLEATPLTSFVVMALIGASPTRQQGSAAQVISEGVRFLVNSVRPDGSWPIDTNLATWVTTLSVNALAAADDLKSLDTKDAILKWLLDQQYTERHPYTGAAPGGWAWTDLAGGVPDCDDTPGALLALRALNHDEGPPTEPAWNPALNGLLWLERLQNRGGGWPTFCRGWGMLPFDRSGSDLTAHAIRAIAAWSWKWFENTAGGQPRNSDDYDEMVKKRGEWWDAWSRIDMGFDNTASGGVYYLEKEQRPDGSWLPLWFGNQHALGDINPVYGTSRVLAAYRDLGLKDSPECQRGVNYLLSVQNEDGGWGGAAGCPSSVEETALAVEVLIDLSSTSPPALRGRGGRADASSISTAGEGAAAATRQNAPSPGVETSSRGFDSDLSPAEPGERCGTVAHESGSPVQRGLAWLVEAVESGRFREASPIGFYFAKLWYFEKLYPLIFTVAALGRAVRPV